MTEEMIVTLGVIGIVAILALAFGIAMVIRALNGEDLIR